MFSRHLWLHPFHDDEWSTDSTSITGNIHGFMMVIDIDPYKFVDLASTSELAELRHKTAGESCEANNGTVNMNHKRGTTINFCSSREANI